MKNVFALNSFFMCEGTQSTSFILSLCVLGLFALPSPLCAQGTSQEKYVVEAIKEDALAQWRTENTPSQSDDTFWQKGTSPELLLRQNTRASAETSGTAGPAKPAKEKNAKQSEGLELAGGAIRGHAETVGSTWHSPGSQEPTIDEDLMHGTHEVLGAYGKMVDEDDFSMSLGPELYIPEEGASVLNKSDERTSEVGMGMKLQWGF